MFCIRFLITLILPLAVWAAETPKMPDVPADLSPEIQTTQPGVKLTLLAEHPDLVTPTGIDVDKEGQIWLIACHTHFRPEGYPGPAHDEILVFDKDGKNRRVFYNKTDATMHVEIGPDGWIYLAERDRILRVKDTDGDGIGDLEETLATLDSVADYPHNGLSGMAWHPDGGLVFSLGENFSQNWTLTARDGSEVKGRGEGGIFRCTADGLKLRRIAHGFWNPFGLTVRDDGEIFAAENDPGSRPPCRLLNIIEGADYGYQRAYGNAPVHPFVAWNGELRGTLGMVHPCSEAPCAILPLGGGVLIPSWSNHCIDYFPLNRLGAGYTSQRIELLHGSDFFRPVSMAQGPDGAFYLTDWVFSSYPIHGRGRLWKLEIDPAQATWIKATPDPVNNVARLATELREGKTKLSVPQLLEHARGKDAYVSDAALTALAGESISWTAETLAAMSSSDRLWSLVAMRRVNMNEPKWVRSLLGDPDPEIRFECLRWISDAVLIEFSSDVEKMLSDPSLNYRVFEAALATWNTLKGTPEAGVTNPDVLAQRILNEETPTKIKGYALRLIPANHKAISLALLRDLLAKSDPALSLEVVRTLNTRNTDDARNLLAEIVENEAQSPELRAEAIIGLAISAAPKHQALLVKLSSSDVSIIRSEAQRALRFTEFDKTFTLNPQRPAFEDTTGWLRLVDSLPGQADPEVGRRIFFHSKIAMCTNCHRHSGGGNVVGPDLSFIAQQGDRAAILRSILEPNREVAPQFYPTQLKLTDGSDFIGILLRSSSTEVYRDLTGKERVFQKADIISRTELKSSLMPMGLVASLTDAELRDLLAFLTKSSAKQTD